MHERKHHKLKEEVDGRLTRMENFFMFLDVPIILTKIKSTLRDHFVFKRFDIESLFQLLN